jgi:hypothetical protein
MRKSFDDILDECIRRLEAPGGDIEAVLSRYPEQADELRPYLEVWASLSAAEKAQATPQGALQGRQQLLNVLATVEHKEGGTEIMKNLSTTGGLALRLVGALAVVAGIAIGITFLTGNLDVDFGSQAEADAPHACLDEVLGGLDGEPGFTVDDILFLRDEAQAGNFTVDDLMVLIGDLRACFQENPSP